MTIPRELNPDLFHRLLSGNRKQVSLAAMLKNQEFKKSLSQKQHATAMTAGPCTYEGEIEFRDGCYMFLLSHPGHLIKSDETLTVLFSLNKKEFYFKARSSRVGPRRIELAQMTPTLNQKHKVAGSVLVREISNEQIALFIAGALVSTRRHFDDKKGGKTDYLAIDEIAAKNGIMAEPYELNAGVAGSLVEFSQVGCCLAVDADRFDDMSGAKLLYVQFTLKTATALSAVSCFAFVKESWQQDDQIVFCCEFLEALPALNGVIADGALEYHLRFEERVIATINGIDYPAADAITTTLPLGLTVISIKWPDGQTTTAKLPITHAMSSDISISRPLQETFQIAA